MHWQYVALNRSYLALAISSITLHKLLAKEAFVLALHNVQSMIYTSSKGKRATLVLLRTLISSLAYMYLLSSSLHVGCLLSLYISPTFLFSCGVCPGDLVQSPSSLTCQDQETFLNTANLWLHSAMYQQISSECSNMIRHCEDRS